MPLICSPYMYLIKASICIDSAHRSFSPGILERVGGKRALGNTSKTALLNPSRRPKGYQNYVFMSAKTAPQRATQRLPHFFYLGNQHHVVRAVVPNANDKLSQIQHAAQVLVEDGEHPLAELGRLGVQVAVELVDGNLQRVSGTR